jgi:hypothetical protein
MGMLHTDLAQWDAAERAYSAARQIFVEQGDAQRQHAVEVNQVELWIARGNLNKHERSVSIFSPSCAPHQSKLWLGEVYKHHAVVCRTLSQLDQAEASFQHAEETANEAGDLLLIAEVARERAEMYWQQ